MIRAKFYDSDLICVYETPVFSASFGRALGKSPEWTMAVPLTETLDSLLSETLTAELWYNDVYCIGGKVQKDSIKYDLDPLIEIKGREEIDALYDAGGDTTLYINNKSFLLQLFTLLEKSGWRFGLYEDIDRTKLITIDLRKEKPRLAQFATLLKQVPKLRYRFGGFDYAGQPLLDVSFFDDPYRYQVLPASPGSQANSVVINDVAADDDYTAQLWALEPIGGDAQFSSTVKRPIFLGDLLNYTTLSLDIAYPIYEEFSELAYVVVPTSEGGVGGRVASVPSTVLTSFTGGDTSGAGTANTWISIIFHPYPGNLSEVSFWFGNNSLTNILIGINAGTNALEWEVREVDESNTTLVTGTLLGSGVVAPASLVINTRCRIQFTTDMAVVGQKRYMFRLGLTNISGAGHMFSIQSAATNNSKSFRADRATTRTGATTNSNVQPLFEAVTGTVDPTVGRRETAYETKFAPTKEGGNALTANIQNAALALYEWSKLRLAGDNQPRHDLSVTLAGFNLDWRPGDVIRVLAQKQYISRNIAEWENRTIESLTYTFSDNVPKMDVKFLPNTAENEDADEAIALYDVQKAKEAKPEGKIIEPPYAWELTELNTVVQFVVADTTLSDGTPAKYVYFPLTAAPVGKGETQVIGTPYGIHSNTATKIVVEVVEKTTSLVTCKIAVRDVGWNLYDSAVIYLHQVWR